MAITQISKIQHRRGLQEDLPQLASAELGWSIDTQQLYIGNGDTAEGAPRLGVTEILTEKSIVNLTNQIQSLTANIGQVVANTPPYSTLSISSSSAGQIVGINAATALINYSLNQGTKQRIGTIKLSHFGSTVSYTDDYSETSPTDIVLSVTGNASYARFNYTTITATTLTYTVKKPT